MLKEEATYIKWYNMLRTHEYLLKYWNRGKNDSILLIIVINSDEGKRWGLNSDKDRAQR
jgi:hypothetical protein